MSKKATEFQRKAMSRMYRGKEIFKPLNTGWIDENVACVREWWQISSSTARAIVMLVLIWERILPLKSTGQRILASLCNPIAFAGIVGNLFTLLPWPLNQIDHGTESTGHLLVLALGLVLLREMTKSGELKEVEVRR